MTLDGRPRTGGPPRPGSVPPATPPAAAPAPAPPTPPGPVPAAEPRPRAPGPPPVATRGQVPPGVARRTGRHARPVARRSSPEGYLPRHAAPDAETELIPVVVDDPAEPDAVTGEALVTPAAAAADDPDPAGAGEAVGPPAGVAVADHPDAPPAKKPLYGYDPIDPGTPVPNRVRVVLAERRFPTRAVRTVAEIEQQTATGEFLLTNLMRAQLALGVRLGLVAALGLVALPVLFVAVPAAGAASVFGVGVPWLVLGVAPYPVLVGLAALYTRNAERNELDFAENVED